MARIVIKESQVDEVLSLFFLGFRIGSKLTDGMVTEKEKTFEHKSTRLGVLT